MSRLKGLALVLVFVATFAFALAPAVSAQTLDGKWYKVNCRVTAKAVDRLMGDITDYTSSFVIYMHFAYEGVGDAPRGSLYEVQTWSKYAPGEWQLMYAGGMETNAYNESVFPEMVISAISGSRSLVLVEGSAIVSPDHIKGVGIIKANKDPQGRYFYGQMTFTGSWVSSIPFDPRA